MLSVWLFEMAFSTRLDELRHEKGFLFSTKVNQTANNENGQITHYGEIETVQKITFESYFFLKRRMSKSCLCMKARPR